MRILVVGAGALGGYFGGCLVRAGRDVTFLVRPQRAAQLARDGLRIRSPHGDFDLPVRTVLAGAVREQFDLVLVAVKSYSLAEAADQFAPAVGPATAILPVINGMRHIESLRDTVWCRSRAWRHGARFPRRSTPTGVSSSSFPSTIWCSASFPDGFSDRIGALSAVLEGAGFNARASDVMMLEMWEKWAAPRDQCRNDMPHARQHR